MVRWPWSQGSEGHGEEVVVSMAAGKPSTEDHHIEKDVLAAGRAACYKVSMPNSLSLALSLSSCQPLDLPRLCVALAEIFPAALAYPVFRLFHGFSESLTAVNFLVHGSYRGVTAIERAILSGCGSHSAH